MILTRLTINNFKGFKTFELLPGKTTIIKAENGKGKSTIMDAYLWCITGKDSFDRKDHEIKPNNQDMKSLNVCVEVEFDLVTLKRCYREVWGKDGTFTGHTTDFFVDGLNVPKKDYEAAISNLFTEEQFKILSNPLYFANNLEWKKRREILFGLVKDIDTGKPPHNEALIKQTLTEIDKKISHIPVTIKELAAQVTEGELTKEQLEHALEQTKLHKKQIEEKQLKEQMETSNEKNIAEIETKIAKIETMYQKKKNENDKAYAEKIKELTKEMHQLEHQQLTNKFAITENATLITSKEKEMDALRTEYKELSKTQVNANDICPTCKQNLPQEQMQATKDEFNTAKSNRLTEIQAVGKKLKDEVEVLKNANIKLESEKESIEEKIRTIELQKTSLSNPSNNFKLEQMLCRQKLLEQKNSIQSGSRTPTNSEHDKIISALEENIAEMQKSLARLSANESIKKRIDELKKEQKQLGIEQTKLMKQKKECEDYTREKIEKLEKAINSKFKLTKFKMFKTLVNGEIEEICEATDGNTVYSTLNRGARMNIGIDIINTLSSTTGVSLPIFIDNAESNTYLEPVNTQSILLYALAGYKELTLDIRK